MSQARRLLHRHGTEYQVCSRRLLGLLRSLCRVDRLIDGRGAPDLRLRSREAGRPLSAVYDGAWPEIPEHPGPAVPRVAGLLAHLRKAVPRGRTQALTEPP